MQPVRQNGNMRWQIYEDWVTWSAGLQSSTGCKRVIGHRTLECHLLSGIYIVDAGDGERTHSGRYILPVYRQIHRRHAPIAIFSVRSRRISGGPGSRPTAPLAVQFQAPATTRWRYDEILTWPSVPDRRSIMYRFVLNNAYDHCERSQNDIMSVATFDHTDKITDNRWFTEKSHWPHIASPRLHANKWTADEFY